MLTKILKATLLSVMISGGAVHAAEVAGKVSANGNVQLVRAGTAKSVSNSSVVYLTDDQVVTGKKSTANLLLQSDKPLLSVFPNSKFAVSQTKPLSVQLGSGDFTGSFKPSQTLSINTSGSSASVKALTSGELSASSVKGQLSLIATSGSFNVTDSSGVSRTIDATQQNALLITPDQSKYVKVALQLPGCTSTASAFYCQPAFVSGAIATLAAAGIIATVVAVEVSNDDDDDAPTSPAIS
jgi:hypothetical protein